MVWDARVSTGCSSRGRGRKDDGSGVSHDNERETYGAGTMRQRYGKKPGKPRSERQTAEQRSKDSRMNDKGQGVSPSCSSCPKQPHTSKGRHTKSSLPRFLRLVSAILYTLRSSSKKSSLAPKLFMSILVLISAAFWWSRVTDARRGS